MDNTTKFLLPSPDFSKKGSRATKSHTHFLTPSGMTLLPREKQPPPMYGPKGSTVPSKYLVTQKTIQEDKPQDRHFCEPCDMEFQSSDDFRRHRTQHERCPVDGCKYRAHPSAMDKHVTELHTSGIFEKIKKISTPEDIAAWREERRKKYPTLANTHMRQLAQEQRQRRGERLEANKSRFGRHEDRKRARNVESSQEQKESSIKNNQQDRNKRGRDKRQQRKKEQPIEKKQKPPPLKTIEQENTVETILACGIRMFEGTSKMEKYQHEKPKKAQAENVLSGLVGMYGSDEEDDDNSEVEGTAKIGENSVEDETMSEKIENDVCNNSRDDQYKSMVQDIEMPTKDNDNSKDETLRFPIEDNTTTFSKNSTKSDALNSNSNFIDFDQTTMVTVRSTDTIQNTNESTEINTADKSLHNSSDEAPEEAPIERSIYIPPAIVDEFSSKNNLDTASSTSRPAKQDNQMKNLVHKRKSGLDYRKLKLRKQNTMLEKLLEPDIRHERNVLLQSVRFVCQNNFFGIGSKNTKENIS